MAPSVCVEVESPSTSANLGAGYDVIAVAHDAFTDRVRACLEPGRGEVVIERITGPQASLSGGASTARAAVESLLSTLGFKEYDVILEVYKGIPVSRGLGSSGASAAAAVYATYKALNAIAGLSLEPWELVLHAGRGEESSAGVPHYDNVAASLLGWIALVAQGRGRLYVRSYRPRAGFYLALAVPEAGGGGKTRRMRGILPGSVSLPQASSYAGRASLLATALVEGDLALAGALMMSDEVVEPVRASVTPCYHSVVEAALEAGALGASLSGAGPSFVALAPTLRDASEASEAMADAYARECGPAKPVVARPSGGVSVAWAKW